MKLKLQMWMYLFVWPSFFTQFSHFTFFRPLAISSITWGGWTLEPTSFETHQINLHVLSHCSWTHSEESAFCPLAHTSAHRHLQLVSVTVTDRVKSNVSSFAQSARLVCSLFNSWPLMSICLLIFWWLREFLLLSDSGVRLAFICWKAILIHFGLFLIADLNLFHSAKRLTKHDVTVK